MRAPIWVGCCLIGFGCSAARLADVGAGAPVRNVVRASQYAITTDFPIEKNDPLVKELLALEDEVGVTLSFRPGAEPIRIVIFENEQAYSEFLLRNYPELPGRRAFFVKQGPDALTVFAVRGERLVRDLRHEATHALLNSVLAETPVWLDEGLAEYFEIGVARSGLNAEHAVKLSADVAARPLPTLAALEAKRDLWQLSAADYRASWLYVHFLLHHSPETRAALLAHFDALRHHQSDSLAERLQSTCPDLSGAILDHLDSLKPR